MTPHPKTLARRAAMRALVAVEKNEVVAPDFSAVEIGTRGFAREIYTGTQRHRARLDWTLAPLLSKPLGKLDPPVRAALRLALYEKLELQTPPHALAGEWAGLMRGERLSSATGFLNAILRRLPEAYREAPKAVADRLATEFSHPQWLVERYLKQLGAAETEALLRANQTRAPLNLRVNTLRTSRDLLLAEIPGARPSDVSPDVLIIDEGTDPTSLPAWKTGAIFAQDEAAQLVSPLVNPTRGSLVVDCAAAPGGKTTHLAQIMGDEGKIRAFDAAPGRVKLIQENARRLKLRIIDAATGDIRKLAAQFDLQEKADFVLLDTPCSGTGTFRRRPDAKWRKTPQGLSELVVLQTELLDAAALLVKPGGILVYSTCSLEREENEGQIENFLMRSGWSVVKPPDSLGHVTTSENFLRTWPHKNGCDGMFAAKLQRPKASSM